MYEFQDLTPISGQISKISGISGQRPGLLILNLNIKKHTQMTCDRHCSTATADVHSTRHRFFTVHADVTPTKVLPAPTSNVRHLTRQPLKSIYHTVYIIISNCMQVFFTSTSVFMF